MAETNSASTPTTNPTGAAVVNKPSGSSPSDLDTSSSTTSVKSSSATHSSVSAATSSSQAASVPSAKKHKKKGKGAPKDEVGEDTSSASKTQATLPGEEEGEDQEGGTEEPEEISLFSRQPGEAEAIKELQTKLTLFGREHGAVRTREEAKQKDHKFWKTQPVPTIDEKVINNEPIEPDKELSEIRAEAYSLPDDFKWETLDLDNNDVMEELYVLLFENYVEDDDAMFRFDYSKPFLYWALHPPGWLQEWHVGVRVNKAGGKLVGFISGVPAHLRVFDKEMHLAEINFLCVHKKLRNKRMAPVLIREITRRVNRKLMFQAVYTAGVYLPKPITTARYWHRSLNPKKLIDVKFSHLGRNMTLQRTLKLYKLPTAPNTPGFRLLKESDISQAHQLFSNYMKKFDVAPLMTEDEFRHWFTPRENIVSSFVVEVDGRITDMCSFYTLCSSIINHPTHKTLRAAYSFYNVATSISLTQLMSDLLIMAKMLQYDVFNALDIMENAEPLKELKFGMGDGNLHYYLYNWRTPDLSPSSLALILQ